MFMMKARDPMRFCDRARTAALMRKWAEDDKNACDDTNAIASETVIKMLDDLAALKSQLAKRTSVSRGFAHQAWGPKTWSGRSKENLRSVISAIGEPRTSTNRQSRSWGRGGRCPGADIDFPHSHHHCERALCFFANSGERLSHPLVLDLKVFQTLDLIGLQDTVTLASSDSTIPRSRRSSASHPQPDALSDQHVNLT